MTYSWDNFEDIYFLSADGATSDVFSAVEKSTKSNVVLKLLNEYSSERGKTLLEREIQIHSRFHHECILPFLGHGIKDDRQPFIVTPLMPFPGINKILRMVEEENGPSWWDATCQYKAIYGISCGLKFCHQHGVLHRDVKPENVFLNSAYEVQIADFGYSRNADTDTSLTFGIGSPFWMAPEVLDSCGYEYSYPIDVYSWGLIVRQILAGKEFPFDEEFTSLEDFSVFILQNDGKPDLSTISEPLRTLIASSIDHNPNNRPTFVEICDELEKPEYYIPGLDVDKFNDYVSRCKSSESYDIPENDSKYQSAISKIYTDPNECIRILTDLIDARNYNPAAIKLGEIYEEGSIVPRNYETAISYYSKNPSSPSGQAHITRMIYERKVPPPENITNVHDYCKSIFSRYPEDSASLLGLGLILLSEGHDMMAAQCFNKAIALDCYNFEVITMIGQLIKENRGYSQSDSEVDESSPFYYFNHAICNNYYKAAINIAESYIIDDKCSKAISLLEKHKKCIDCFFYLCQVKLDNKIELSEEELEFLNSHELPESYLILASYYEKKDGSKVIKYLNKAGNNGAAYERLGQIYRKGIYGVQQDHQKAFEYFKKSAEMNNGEGYSALGRCYEEGRGCPQNLKKARKLFTKSANLGNRSGCLNLGRICINDNNFEFIENLMLRAIHPNFPQTYFNLAVLYKEKASGPLKRKCVKWFKKAAQIFENLGFVDFAVNAYSMAAEFNDKEALRCLKRISSDKKKSS